MPRRFWILAGSFLLLTTCQTQEEPITFVARVHDAYLIQEDIDAALENLPLLLDSTETRQQFVDQWVVNELLYQEALRRNLRMEETVRRRLRDGERDILIDALVSLLYEEEIEPPRPEEIHAYFEQHKEQLRLREPFLRVRYIYNASRDSIAIARTILRQAASVEADSLFPLLAQRFSENPTLSLSLADNYFPENRLFLEQPELREQLSRLTTRSAITMVVTDNRFHLLQIADRIPSGTLPELPWVENQVLRQLTIDTRKQMYERQVQRLRVQALSSETLVIK